MKLLTPILLIIASVGVFIMVINPHYKKVNELRSQSEAHDAAIAQATAVVAKRSELVSKKNSFSEADLEKLKVLLPDQIDTIRYIIDVNKVANLSGANLKDIKVAGDSQQTNIDTKPYGTVSMSFTVEMTYNQFLKFLSDLEHSLKIMDVSSIVIAPTDDKPTYTYGVTIKSYWLKP